jgi:hypothetical protein
MNVESPGSKTAESARAKTFPLLFIYIFINALFVWKYGSQYFPSQSIAPVLYVVISVVILWVVLSPKIDIELSPDRYRLLYITCTLVATIFLIILMFQFDPKNIAVGRYPAIYDWITKLIHGEFPYASPMRPSGFPFLFIMAIPFYLLGDIGLFQIFSFIIFAGILYYKFRGSYKTSLRLLILLLISPIFIFEVVVRSELFSNMVIVLFYLIICEKYFSRETIYNQIFLGLIGGLLLSTRSIVLVLYILYFIPQIRDKKMNPFILIGSMIFGFLITLIPFAIWNYDYFINNGPLAVQILYAPKWLIVLFVLATIIWAMKIKTIPRVYFASASMLFIIVFVAFIYYAIRFGIIDSVIGDQFDISYFIFPLPFVLMSLGSTTGRYNMRKSPP